MTSFASNFLTNVAFCMFNVCLTIGLGKKLLIKDLVLPQDRFDKWCTDGSSDFRFVTNSDFLANGVSPSSSKHKKSENRKADDKVLELHENALGKLRWVFP